MVNTLRITSVAAVLLAALVLASVLGGPKSLVNLGMKSDAKLEGMLKDPNVVDRFRKSSAGKTSSGADQVPVLVKQAQDFAKILRGPELAVAKPAAQRGDKGPIRPVASSAKFTLVGLSYSAVRPEESFAYIRLDDNTVQWVRKDDEIGHMTIRDIRQGSIVCWDGSRESEMAVTPPPETASLLEASAGAVAGGDNAGLSAGPASDNSARQGQGNSKDLRRIADQIQQFQQEGNSGDPNEAFRDRAAIMSQMVSELNPPQPNGPVPPRPGDLDPDTSKPPVNARPLPRRSGFRPPLTGARPRTN
jgi:hypothetical protein